MDCAIPHDANQDTLNLAEQFRQVLNQLRVLDLRSPERHWYESQSRRLLQALQGRGVDAVHLLHDRSWALRPVPGAAPVKVCPPRTLFSHANRAR